MKSHCVNDITVFFRASDPVGAWVHPEVHKREGYYIDQKKGSRRNKDHFTRQDKRSSLKAELRPGARFGRIFQRYLVVFGQTVIRAPGRFYLITKARRPRTRCLRHAIASSYARAAVSPIAAARSSRCATAGTRSRLAVWLLPPASALPRFGREMGTGRMTFEQAQHAIATDWIAAYQPMLHSRVRIGQSRCPCARASIVKARYTGIARGASRYLSTPEARPSSRRQPQRVGEVEEFEFARVAGQRIQVSTR